MKDWNISAGRKYTDNIFQLDERSTYVPLPAPPRVSLLPPPTSSLLQWFWNWTVAWCSIYVLFLCIHPSIYLSSSSSSLDSFQFLRNFEWTAAIRSPIRNAEDGPNINVLPFPPFPFPFNTFIFIKFYYPIFFGLISSKVQAKEEEEEEDFPTTLPTQSI